MSHKQSNGSSQRTLGKVTIKLLFRFLQIYLATIQFFFAMMLRCMSTGPLHGFTIFLLVHVVGHFDLLTYFMNSMSSREQTMILFTFAE